VPLRLIAGPANAGKVELLLGRYLDALDAGDGAEPVLIVPNWADVDRVQFELLTRRGALLGGSIGTFEDVFRRVAAGSPDSRPVVDSAERALLVRRIVSSADLHRLAGSAAHGGFVDSLQQALDELEAGLLAPEAVEGELGALYSAYRDELENGRLVVTICSTGARAGVAASALAAEGVRARPVLDSGMDDWEARGNTVTAFRRCGGSG
jgi:rhodanese-related sulfurtransferase